jgi:hypothetical protein
MRLLTAIACFAVTASLHAGSYGVGVQAVFDQGNGNAITPRADFLHATDSSTVSSVALSATANIPTLGVDWDWFPGKDVHTGFYGLVGVGVGRINLEVSGSTAAAAATTTVHKLTGYPEAGLGWEFTRHVGLELLYKDLRYHDVVLDLAGTTAGYSLSGTVQGSLVVRF